MTILHISDTHGKHNDINLNGLPHIDVVIHSGDFTFAGGEEEACDFMNWFSDLEYPHKIFIAGNHDMCMYGAETIDGLPDNVHYLCNSGVVIEGFKFFGLPMFMEDFNDGNLDKMIKDIPTDTDILITHQPPYGFCDIFHGEHFGDRLLRDKLKKLARLKCHLFGHQHDANSLMVNGGVIFSNAAVLDCYYNFIADPRIIEL